VKSGSINSGKVVVVVVVVFFFPGYAVPRRGACTVLQRSNYSRLHRVVQPPFQRQREPFPIHRHLPLAFILEHDFLFRQGILPQSTTHFLRTLCFYFLPDFRVEPFCLRCICRRPAGSCNAWAFSVRGALMPLTAAFAPPPHHKGRLFTERALG
jgi:hypothetical protein